MTEIFIVPASLSYGNNYNNNNNNNTNNDSNNSNKNNNNINNNNTNNTSKVITVMMSRAKIMETGNILVHKSWTKTLLKTLNVL